MVRRYRLNENANLLKGHYSWYEMYVLLRYLPLSYYNSRQQIQENIPARRRESTGYSWHMLIGTPGSILTIDLIIGIHISTVKRVNIMSITL